MKRTPLHIALTLLMIATIYGSPWVLAVIGSQTPDFEFEQLDFDDDPIVQVVWNPASSAATDDASSLTSEPVETAPIGSPPVAFAQPSSSTNARPSNKAQRTTQVSRRKISDAPPTSVMRPRAAAKRPKRRRAHPRTSTPPTKQQVRRRARRIRQRDRIAKQPQCHDLIGQIVQVGDNEWMVGRNIVGCYRAHPRQFMRMGGMAWVEDEHHKRVGLRIFVSRHQRGDVARAVGIERGDILRSLNGVPLRSMGGASVALTQMLGNRAKLKVLRHGKEHRILLRVVGDKKLQRAREEQAALAQD